jgi:RecA/RadA recombinase
MIPPVFGSGATSAGEREIFLRLRDDPGAAAWIVLHSLGLARHDAGVAGEVDFVVIIPTRGVICVEVKGCSASTLRRDGGLWFYGPGDRGDPRSPFRQASEAMHSLRRDILRNHPELSGILFASGVVFPYAQFAERSPEWHPWEVIDTLALRSAPIHLLLTHMLESASAHVRSVPRAPRIVDGSPTPTQCEILRDALRGDFEIPAERSARSSALRDELLRFTEEQYVALDAMTENPRTLFVGPAGTGKTFLALEAVRRARAAGRRVLFLCFNRLLGSWLARQAAALQPEVTTRTLHQHLLSISQLSEVPAEAPSGFWASELPALACERLVEAQGEDRWLYDELVVDEVQDLSREPYLGFLDLSLRGGLGSGRWRIFGDFENQSIYGSTGMDLAEFRRRSGGAPLFELRVNCRNTPLVVEYAQLLSDLRPRYHRVLRPDDGVQPTLSFYRSADDQCQLLTETLSELERLGFADDEIVVLSPRADGACAARVRTSPWASRLRPFTQASLSSVVAYASIRAFKGLETAAVVVTDVETLSTPEARSLFYVATTRPLQRLVIIANERVRAEAVSILRGVA